MPSILAGFSNVYHLWGLPSKEIAEKGKDALLLADSETSMVAKKRLLPDRLGEVVPDTVKKTQDEEKKPSIGALEPITVSNPKWILPSPLAIGSLLVQSANSLSIGLYSVLDTLKGYIPTNINVLKGLEGCAHAACHLRVPVAALTLAGTYSMIDYNRKVYENEERLLEERLFTLHSLQSEVMSDVDRRILGVQESYTSRRLTMEQSLARASNGYYSRLIVSRYLGFGISCANQLYDWTSEVDVADFFRSCGRLFTGWSTALNLYQNVHSLGNLALKRVHLTSIRTLLQEGLQDLRREQEKLPVGSADKEKVGEQFQRIEALQRHVSYELARLEKTVTAYYLSNFGCGASLALMIAGMALEQSSFGWQGVGSQLSDTVYGVSTVIAGASACLPMIADTSSYLVNKTQDLWRRFSSMYSSSLSQ